VARGALLAALALGLTFGFGQWARGAHFVSHDLWSAAICWFVSLGLYLFPFRGRLSYRAGRQEITLDVHSPSSLGPKVDDRLPVPVGLGTSSAGWGGGGLGADAG
jgi:hypothetical protein